MNGSIGRITKNAALDLLIAAVILLAFAYFQHGRAFLKGELAVDLSDAVPVSDVAQSTPPEEVELRSNLYDSKFAVGDPVQTENSYKSENISVTWERYEETIDDKTVVYYVADIYTRSADYICTAMSEDGYETVQKLAKENNAILAINGDYAPARERGVIVRDGMLIRDSSFGDVLAFYTNGEMKTFSADEFDLESEADAGLRDAWSFGPALLDEDGCAKTEFDTTVAEAHPRTAIGYYAPGHYCFVAVNGRGEENSAGMTMTQLSALFESLGCTAAYNLDGGQSSVMAWDCGSVTVNTPANGGRPVSDIIYIPKD